ncbi:GlsB/YeaQ/YmgE family stress response membrane protein [Prosthecobacter sp.]|uniref:GlsB/YeaQ/YmgE family stress response membrane protein n=1 Tax=Prosthecobacter sp. TaxID=1965333 RepID=UPI002488544A|nr:GlsB/YeaQ/YmgE family stress response membrane protein [Prosthecobacter sp.]MDI1312851.1 GlsB/YeaQ/YmgE family stress response membrane protein [Prosthecobacter sp.]
MTFLWMLLIGLFVGAIAKFLTPGKDPSGCLVTMILGVVGSMLAGFLGRSAGWYAEGEPVGFIASVIGAVLILLVFRMIKGRS